MEEIKIDLFDRVKCIIVAILVLIVLQYVNYKLKVVGLYGFYVFLHMMSSYFAFIPGLFLGIIFYVLIYPLILGSVTTIFTLNEKFKYRLELMYYISILVAVMHISYISLDFFILDRYITSLIISIMSGRGFDSPILLNGPMMSFHIFGSIMMVIMTKLFKSIA